MFSLGIFGRRRSRLAYRRFQILLLNKLSKLILLLIGASIIGVFFLFIWYSRDLPKPGKLIAAQQTQSTRIYDRNGILLYSVYHDYNRIYVKLDDIPQNVRDATIAVEDETFYKNTGFDWKGMLRALRDIVFLRGLAGGSTITQQLVKNVLLTSEQTLPRKMKELILAIQVNKLYTKDQILEMYLNDVGYGGAAVGVEAASQLYFGKHAKELDLAQSAFIAGLPQAPSSYSPFSGNKYYIDRTAHVLSQMARNNMINKSQSDAALSEIKNTTFAEKDKTIKAPHFVMYVKKLLADQFGEPVVENGGLQVTTTLDYTIEQEAEKIVNSEIGKLKIYKVTNGAAMLTDPKTGEILAMVGSKDYFDTKNDGNFNVAVSPYRQPGSSLKPVMYATALEKGYTASTLLMDTKTEFPTIDPNKPYIPINYDEKFRGPVQVRFALGNSLNVPAVKMLAQVGIKDVMQKGFDMGINSWEPTEKNLSTVGLSLILGGKETSLYGEMTAYGALANGGVRNDLYAYTKVTDSNGHTLYEHKNQPGKRVLSPEVSFIISHILLDNNAREMEFGPSSYLVIPGKTVSVKTGTTDEKRDNWTYGYTPSYVVGVWVGNNDNSPMNPIIASGITGASPIWNRIMTFVLQGKKDEQPQKPDNVDAFTIDAYGGGTPVDGRPTRSEYFIKGTQPTAPSPIYKKIKVSKSDNNKLASDSEIAHGEYDTKSFIVFSETDPVSTDGKNRWHEGIDAWIKQTYAADHPEFYPPTQKSDKQIRDNPTPTQTPTQTPAPSSGSSPTPSSVQTSTPTLTPTP